jgi:Fic family protein
MVADPGNSAADPELGAGGGEPGTEVPITWRGRRARAWVPAPLATRRLDLSPTTARRTGEALALVSTAGRTLPSLGEPVARLLLRAEGLASSNIEGLRVPLAELAAAELDGSGADATASWVADNLAVVGRALAGAATSDLSVDLLHEWHRRLMRSSGLDPAVVGAFRSAQGWVGGTSPLDAAFVPPPPELVPGLMEDLVAFANTGSADPVTQAGALHAQFEAIHPYGDGNGRVGRLLVPWTLSRRTGTAVPPPVSVLISRDVGGYLAGLYDFRSGQVDRWVGWFAGVVCGSAEAAAAVVGALDRLIGEWKARLSGLRRDALALRLVDLLPAHPVVSSSVVAAELAVSERTARRALVELAEAGIVRPYEPARRRPGRPEHWWLAGELIEAVTGWLA